MSSPAKVRKDGEDAVEGFIRNVLPRRQSNSTSFFAAVLERARQEYHKVVVFSMEK